MNGVVLALCVRAFALHWLGLGCVGRNDARVRRDAGERVSARLLWSDAGERKCESAKVRSLVNGEVNRGEGRKEGREEPLLRTGVGAWGWSW